MKELKVFEPESSVKLRAALNAVILGQPDGVDAVVEQYTRYRAGLEDGERPAAVVLLAGPTGVGKTGLALATADFLCGSEKACVQIDCGEYQYGHEIAKLIGSPPGYLGHRETQPILTSEALTKSAAMNGISVVLWDEIEKSHSAIRNLLLGVMDKGRLTTGANLPVSFTSAFNFLTSNIGFEEQSKLPATFTNKPEAFRRITPDDVLNKIKREFAPEFINRIDRIVVMNYVSPELAKSITHLHIERLAARVWAKYKVILQWSNELEEFILARGYSEQYGVRDIKRNIDAMLVSQLGSVLLNGNLKPNDKGQIIISATARKGRVVLLQ